MIRKIISAFLAVLIIASTAIVVIADAQPMAGDVNGDLKVNIKDATLIQKHLAKLNTLSQSQLLLSDVDGKKGVSIKDVTHLQKWLAGLVKELFMAEAETVPTTAYTASTQPESVASSDLTEEATQSVVSSFATCATETLATDPAEIITTVAISESIKTEPTEVSVPAESVLTLPTDPTEATSQIPTETTSATEPVSSLPTDPTEVPTQITTETSGATEPSEETTMGTTVDPNKPIELPFVPAK